MQRMPFTGVDLSDRDFEAVIARAKIARVQYLHDQNGRALKAIGLSALAFCLALLLVVGAGPSRHQAFENTVVMEQLAASLAHAETIPPKTLDEISQLMRRPDYDCRRLACDTWIEKRNLAARNRLQMILAGAATHAGAVASK